MDDLIPEDYTLIDVAYYYNWKKEAPMKFFYRIFKKNRVLLKRRKRKLETEESSATADTSGSKVSKSSPDENGKNVESVVDDKDLGQAVDNIRSCPAAVPAVSQITKATNVPAVNVKPATDPRVLTTTATNVTAVNVKPVNDPRGLTTTPPTTTTTTTTTNESRGLPQTTKTNDPRGLTTATKANESRGVTQTTTKANESRGLTKTKTNDTPRGFATVSVKTVVEAAKPVVAQSAVNNTSQPVMKSDVKKDAVSSPSLKKDNEPLKWSPYAAKVEEKAKVEPKPDPEPVKMETDEHQQDVKKPQQQQQKQVEPVREMKIISLLGPGKTAIVNGSEIVKKPETKENDAPSAAKPAQIVTNLAPTTTEQSLRETTPPSENRTATDTNKKSEVASTNDKAVNSSTTTSSTVTAVTSTLSSHMQQQHKAMARKPGSGSQILSVINNLAKKQQTLEAASGNNKEVKTPSMIHGQTTITKRVGENGAQSNGVNTSTTTGAASATTTTPNNTVSHHIPSGTTITVKQATPSSASSATTKTNSAVNSNIRPATTAGPNSLPNTYIQTPKPLHSMASTTTTQAVISKPKQVIADLRQYRKCPPSSDGASATLAATTTTTTTSNLNLSRPPIIPQLTLSGRMKTTQGAGTISHQHGSHRLPASTSAAGGIATSRPMSMSGNSIGRLPSAFPSGMSQADQQKALQMLRLPISSMVGKSTSPSLPTSSPSTTSYPPTSSHLTSSVTAAQLPSNRLQLKVQQPPITGISPFQAAFQSSLYSHLAAESMWKHPLMNQAPTFAQSSSPTSKSPTSNGKGHSNLPKTVNQGIRQIPNPSLLTNKQQAAAAEQFMMAMAAANFANNARASPNK